MAGGPAGRSGETAMGRKTRPRPVSAPRQRGDANTPRVRRRPHGTPRGKVILEM
eukprot:COSAG02_NODE_34074_length_490_cov_0.531969_1_plen_53_part_10